jgi:hypothetical protein
MARLYDRVDLHGWEFVLLVDSSESLRIGQEKKGQDKSPSLVIMHVLDGQQYSPCSRSSIMMFELFFSCLGTLTAKRHFRCWKGKYRKH